MALQNMIFEYLPVTLPVLDAAYAKTLINEAWKRCAASRGVVIPGSYRRLDSLFPAPSAPAPSLSNSAAIRLSVTLTPLRHGLPPALALSSVPSLPRSSSAAVVRLARAPSTTSWHSTARIRTDAQPTLH